MLGMPFPALQTHPGTAPQPLAAGTAGPSFLLGFCIFKQNQQSLRDGFFPCLRQQDFVALQCSAPAKVQHLSSSRVFFPWGWDRGDGEWRWRPFRMSHWHPQSVPVKMSPHTSMSFLSPADCVVLTAGAKASYGAVGASSSTQTCWAVGAHTWGPGRAAQHRISLLAVIHHQGRGIRLRRERNIQWLLALWWVRAAGFGAVHYANHVGLCKISLFVLPVKGKELCRARTVLGGEICSCTDGDTGAPATGGGCPLTPCPTVPTGISSLLLVLGSPARIQQQAKA